ncbi:MAG: hypothetical protein C0446_12490 [Chitinophaga sp.]|nr:hypothetical protein [Chitinophaga sp.]
MIPLLNRQQVFEKSWIADSEIANRQKFYFAQFEGEGSAIIAAVTPVYDHLNTLSENLNKADSFCILTYDEELAGSNYMQGFANAFSIFLQHCGITEIILVQDLRNDWNTFGFDSEKNKTTFFELIGINITYQGLLLNQSSLIEILPLLYFNNPDQGDCSFYTLNNDLPLCILFWKGNFHVSCLLKDKEKLLEAADKAKLVISYDL